MHSSGRHWRRWLWLAILALLFCGSATAAPIVGDVTQGRVLSWETVFFLVVPVYVVFYIWTNLSQFAHFDIAKSRARERRRRRALAGDLIAMPLVCPLGPPRQPEGSLALPLTRTPWINLYAAVTLCGAGVSLLWVEAVGVVLHVRHGHDAPPTPQIPKVEVSTGEAVVIRLRTPVRVRLAIASIAAVLIGDFIPIVQAAPASQDHLAHVYVGNTLACAGLIGVLLGPVAWIGGGAVVSASDVKLEVREYGSRPKTLTWGDVATLAVSFRHGRITKFSVVGNGLTATTIEWPADARQCIRDPPRRCAAASSAHTRRRSRPAHGAELDAGARGVASSARKALAPARSQVSSDE